MEAENIAVRTPIEHTFAFVAAVFGRFGLAAGARVLEIGCGRGELAVLLSGGGGGAVFEIVGVDSDTQTVRDAIARGVRAVEGEWPGDSERVPRGDGFDAVLFTRSLHHVHDLAGGLDRARDVLRPGGLLVIEDFAFSEATASDALWLFSHVDILCAAGLIAAGVRDRALGAAGATAIDAWLADHDHELHSWPAMERAVAQRFEIAGTASTPYLYRYLHALLDESGAEPAAAGSVVQRFFQHEVRRECELGAKLIGRRMVARRHPGRE